MHSFLFEREGDIDNAKSKTLTMETSLTGEKLLRIMLVFGTSIRHSSMK